MPAGKRAANRREPAYVRLKDVADALSLDYTTVYRMVKRGEIESVGFGRGRYQVHRVPVAPLVKQFPHLAGKFAEPKAVSA